MTGGILALDVATTTGWAYGMPGDRPAFGHFRSGKPRDATGEVLAQFRVWLDRCCAKSQPRMVVFEAPYVPRFAPKKVRTKTGQVISTTPSSLTPIDIYVVRRLFAMCGLVEMIAYEHNIPCREEQSNVICRHFTGNGSWGGRENKKAATQKMCAVLRLSRPQRGRGRRARALGLCRGGAVPENPKRRAAVRARRPRPVHMRIDLLRLSGALSAAKPARPPIGRARGLILALGLGAALWALIIWIIAWAAG